MKTKLFTIALLALCTFSLQAQKQKTSFLTGMQKPAIQTPHFLGGSGGAYYLIMSNTTYVPLTGGTDISGGLTWDDPEFNFPLGFSFEMFGTVIDSLWLDGFGAEFIIQDMTTFTSAHFLSATQVDLIDRGVVAAGGVNQPGSQSPIVFKTDGTAPNRIFKLEWQNAGFFNEWFMFNTTNDFINLQLWLYEGSNDFELRFGPAKTGNGASYDIYEGFNGHFIGVLGEISFSTFVANEGLYCLSGPAANPTMAFIDSFDLFTMPPTLNDTIPNGKVYRFSTSPQVGISSPEVAGFRLFPTLADDVVRYSHSSGNPLVLRVFDLTGRPVMQAIHATDATGAIGIGHLPAGMYVVEARSDGNLVSARRFVKQ